MQFVPEYDEFMIYTTLSESLRTLEVEDIYITFFFIKNKKEKKNNLRYI